MSARTLAEELKRPSPVAPLRSLTAEHRLETARATTQVPPSLETAHALTTGPAPSAPTSGHDFRNLPVHAASPAAGRGAAASVAQSCPLPAGPRACPFGGACHTCPTHVQAKAEIGEPGDPFEREADEVAERVMRMADPRAPLATPKDGGSREIHIQRACTTCDEDDDGFIQAKSRMGEPDGPRDVEAGLRGTRGDGLPLDPGTRAFMETRFGHDFGHVRIHTDAQAAESARAVRSLAHTVGHHVVFGEARYAPETTEGRRLLAHELTHVVQQRPGGGGDRAERRGAAAAVRRPVTVSSAAAAVQLRAAPYLNKVTVHLAPPQSADLEWVGTPPATATGSDHFQVSTGKGYGDPGDPPGTCTRDCCADAMTQCAPPYNQPGRVGSCCTYYGSTFWTGTPESEHNGWKFWTPIQPYYSTRGIALHQHTEVTGKPIGHGCVRMAEENAQRIAEFSNGGRTNVTIDGRAAPVACDAARQCGSVPKGSGATREAGTEEPGAMLAVAEPAVPGLEGEMT